MAESPVKIFNCVVVWSIVFAVSVERCNYTLILAWFFAWEFSCYNIYIDSCSIVTRIPFVLLYFAGWLPIRIQEIGIYSSRVIRSRLWVVRAKGFRVSIITYSNSRVIK